MDFVTNAKNVETDATYANANKPMIKHLQKFQNSAPLNVTPYLKNMRDVPQSNKKEISDIATHSVIEVIK